MGWKAGGWRLQLEGASGEKNCTLLKKKSVSKNLEIGVINILSCNKYKAI